MSRTMSRVRLPDGSTVHSVNRNEAEYLYREIFVDRGYLPDGGLALPPSPVVFDIGANIGLFTLFAHREWDSPVVHAFEPVPQLCDVLRRNARGLRGVTVHQCALSDREGSTEICYYPGFTMMSGLHADADRDRELVRAYVRNTMVDRDEQEQAAVSAGIDELLDERLSAQHVPCQVRTLSAVLSEVDVDRIDLLKVDVEGSELAVLQGIGEADWPRIHNAVVEVTDDAGQLAGVRELFAAHGMRTEVRQSPDYRDTSVYLLYAGRPR